MPIVSAANPAVISTAGFFADTFNFDPLVAGDTISQSAKIAGSLGVLKRGTVLFGPLQGVPITTATLLTTVATGAVQRVILAQDIDTTGGAVTGLVYTQGKFLDTAMTFTTSGAASDCANLWDFGVYVLTVEQRSGLLVPMTGLPATGGPLPQALSAKDAAKASKDEVESIKSTQAAQYAMTVPPPTPAPPAMDPPWYTAEFGERPLTKEQQAQEKASEQSAELAAKQEKDLAELQAKQQKELSDMLQKQQEARDHLAKHEADAMARAEQQDNPPAPPAAGHEPPPTPPPPRKRW